VLLPALTSGAAAAAAAGLAPHSANSLVPKVTQTAAAVITKQGVVQKCLNQMSAVSAAAATQSISR
jgi:hypothetical protein